ncbi:NAD(P)/FAD-dependent oxidoreductase [Pseudomarimonas salicorniae]|uniref:Tryptophan 7-halogenase n=1 Tax=Pseudomarimonas salicorniae TaxID=2933270 RepID=A0ABT0GCV0_9GAMM|nr:NAD(P)/FAD-dependent oxidoreductase [Lysobacter sp. CAU 1642]MCK7592360.1 tryptophan 7-halogenase [Lysobacter sp. CAU 1642]
MQDAGNVDNPDVLVAGGGPAGSTIATLLARRGWRVCLLEKDRHPRFHIGESLLPMNLPILERLGVLEAVRAIGVHKAGADFPIDAQRTNTFHFRRALGARHDHAFQVRRDAFDALLFAHARAAGVDAREGAEVTAVEWDERGAARVSVREAGAERALRPRYVVDASGRDTLLARQLRLKRRNPRHQSAAIFSHYLGVSRREGEDAGNISILRFEHGWIWLIPLSDGLTSVGAVCSPDYLKTRRGDREGFLAQTLLAIPQVAARMQGAERAAPVHVTGNYSYACDALGGRGWIAVGDAYAFIDPVFSSGVFLAMDSAEQGAEVVDGALREPARERGLQQAMRRRLERGTDEFRWFIYRFNSPVMRELFARPRNHWQIEQAVISMLAGDVFDNPAVRRRLRAFRMVYRLTALRMAPQALRSWWRRRADARAAFAEDTLQSSASQGGRA